MKRFFLTLMIVATALLNGTKALAYDCEVDGIYYYRISTTDWRLPIRCSPIRTAQLIPVP